MNRFRTLETLQAAARAQLPGAAVQWLAALRGPLEKLTIAALDSATTDAEFAALVEAFAASLPGLLEKMDAAPIAELLANSMGAAMANGISQRAP